MPTQTIETQLLVIGGGATGLGIAWDATLRGIKTILVEKGDIGHGTSGRFHGLLHSGARYVVTDPQSARDCAWENKTLRQIIPHAIEDTGGLYLSMPATDATPEEIAWPDKFYAACQDVGIPIEELSAAAVFKAQPHINKTTERGFRVQDAAIDSFELLHALAHNIRALDGQILLRHRVTELIRVDNVGFHGRINGAELQNLHTGETLQIRAPLTINAAGPWAGQIAQMAGIHIPLTAGKGAMLAFNTRPTHTVLHHCRRPTHGDILVPVGGVAVIGTTNAPTHDPDDFSVSHREVEFLMQAAANLIPTLAHARPLRVWSGSRPLYTPPAPRDGVGHVGETRAHHIIHHPQADEVLGLISIIGGKLTTFRHIAQEVVDQVVKIIGSTETCKTASTPLSSPENRQYYSLAQRLAPRVSAPADIICECEGVTRTQLEAALAADPTDVLNDLRRDTRLGMGPCQGAFCAARAAAILHESRTPAQRAQPNGQTGIAESLLNFLQSRWKGIAPVAWGANLRQAELHRLIHLENLGAQHLTRTVDPEPQPSERNA